MHLCCFFVDVWICLPIYCTITQLRHELAYELLLYEKKTLKWPKLNIKGFYILAHVLGIAYFHLQVRGKSLGITVKESAMTTYIQQRSIGTHSFSQL